MTDSIKARVFIVGCPRSGTTLLQSMLAAHQQITSFPESHFFLHLYPHNRRLTVTGLTSKMLLQRVERFLEEIGHPQWRDRLPRRPWPRGAWARRFLAMLDRVARDNGTPIWIEKTPDHVNHVETIERWVRAPRFIHIVRPGADVIASLYDVGRRYPDQWPAHSDLDKCIDTWNRAVRSTMRHADRPNHRVVRYASLVERPETVLRDLCDFLQITFTPDLLDRRRESVSSIVQSDEAWKAQVGDGIERDRASKFADLLSPPEQQRVRERLVDISVLDEATMGTS